MSDAGTFDDTMLASEGEPSGSGGEPERQDGLQRGAMLGRYVVLELLGAGGMGEVYTAYDPELDRKVALKVLRPSLSQRTDLTVARARLQREAQAMAKLSHPNVIPVFDVGTLDGDVYVAMEYVAGTDLRKWNESGERAWDEILARYCEAAQGLAAAHQADVIHRDFKSDNVLLGDDGRVRVIDFGLAHQGHNDPIERTGNEPRDIEALIEKFRSQVGDAVTTKTGTMMGTPAYMASEQFLGGHTDERTDQYNFAASLYEALYGQLPYAGDSLATLMHSVTEGVVREPPENADVPAWLSTALVPALDSDPNERYPSMEALLDALTPPVPLMRRFRWPLLMSAAVLAAAALMLLLGRRAAAETPCRDMGAPMDNAWHERKAVVKQAMLTAGARLGASAWQRVEKQLDTYAQAWTAARQDSCEATAVRKEQSEAMLERRMSCLDGRLRELDALVTVFAAADGPVLENAARAASSLESVDTCANRTRLGSAPIAPPEKRSTANALQRRLAAVRALKNAGKYDAALSGAKAVLPEARTLGWKPVIARALFWIGDLESRAGNGAEAMEALFESIRTAAAARDTLTEAMAWIKQVHITGVTNRRLDDGMRWSEHARVALVNAGGDPDLESELLFATGHVLAGKKRYEAAISAYRSSTAIVERAHGPDHWMVAITYAAIGSVYTRTGRYQEAVRSHRESAARTERALGGSHPYLATVYSNLGNPLRHLGLFAEAKRAYTRALTIKLEVLAPTHSTIALVLAKLGLVEEHLGDFAAAANHFERALALRVKLHGADHRRADAVRRQLARVRIRQGRLADALMLRRGVLERAESREGSRAEATGIAHSLLCDSLRRAKEYTRATAHCRSAVAILATKAPDELASALTHVGLLDIERGRHAAAIAPLERALQVGAKDKWVKSHHRARTRLALARALWGSGRNRVKAVSLARTARDEVNSTPGPGDRWLLPQVDRFLAGKPGGRPLR